MVRLGREERTERTRENQVDASVGVLKGLIFLGVPQKVGRHFRVGHSREGNNRGIHSIDGESVWVPRLGEA